MAGWPRRARSDAALVPCLPSVVCPPAAGAEGPGGADAARARDCGGVVPEHRGGCRHGGGLAALRPALRPCPSPWMCRPSWLFQARSGRRRIPRGVRSDRGGGGCMSPPRRCSILPACRASLALSLRLFRRDVYPHCPFRQRPVPDLKPSGLDSYRYLGIGGYRWHRSVAVDLWVECQRGG